MFRVLVLVLFGTGLCVPSFAARRDPDIREDAAALRGRWNSLLRQKAQDCDSVRVTYKWYLAESQVVQISRSSEAVRALLEAIEVVEDHNGASVGCFGPYRYEFMRGGKVMADISEACNALFWRDGPWVGTPLMTERGRKALFAWSQRYFGDR